MMEKGNNIHTSKCLFIIRSINCENIMNTNMRDAAGKKMLKIRHLLAKLSTMNNSSVQVEIP